MDGIIMTVQLLLSLSILVGVHEMGHLVAAKFFGMRVEKFSIGFPPKIWGFTVGETEYSIGAIPLGGFVKITGMIDESLDTSTLNKEPEPYEFRAKPAWQRLIVMLGGIIVNVVIGVITFIMLVFVLGDQYISRDEAMKNGIDAGTYAESLGFQDGDKILAVNGEEFEDFSAVSGADVLLADGDVTYTIERGGQQMDIVVPKDSANALADKDKMNEYLQLQTPFILTGEIRGDETVFIDIMKGDRPVMVDSVSFSYFNEFQKLLAERKNSKVDITVLRDGEYVTLKDVKVFDNGTIGGAAVDREISFTHLEYTFVEAIPVGTRKAFEVVILNAKALLKVFTGEMDARDSLTGPIGIASMFGGQIDWARFWHLTGLLSMVLAFMNLLPIPALDGGHVVFLLYEMVSGRKPSDKFLENSQKVGMIILLALMVFVIFNDTIKAIF